jgi:hypothetical protein
VINGCPKHGQHLLVMMAAGVCEALPASIYNDGPTLGTFWYNSFTTQWLDLERWYFLMSRVQQGQYVKGHIGWTESVARFMEQARMAHVFITRDLRDVAVSQAYHILSGDETNNRHPAKAMYRAIEKEQGFDGVLEAVITGVGPFPGVSELFEAYAPWLEERNVHHVKFEDALEDLEGTAAGMLGYGIEQFTSGIWEDRYVVDKGEFDKTAAGMVNIAAQKERSPTFRHGVAGDWEALFKDRHVSLFKAHDRGQWLQQLGYVEDDNW